MSVRSLHLLPAFAAWPLGLLAALACDPGPFEWTETLTPADAAADAGPGRIRNEPSDAGTPWVRDAGATCAPSDKTCLDPATLRVCAEGRWKTMTCPKDTPFCGGTRCLECEPGQSPPICRSAASYECNADGSYELAERCEGKSPVCLTATGTCGTCSAGQEQCSADLSAVETCNEYGEFQASACEGSTPVCQGSSCVECSTEAGLSTRCSGTTPLVCRDDRWVAQAPCSNDTPICNQETGACACAEGTFRCQGLAKPRLERCESGSWNAVATCEDTTPLCDAVEGRCVCDNGSTRCEGEGTRLECLAGTWVARTCPSSAPLCHGGDCVACIPGSADWCEPPEWDGWNLEWKGGVLAHCVRGVIEHTSCDFLCYEGDCLDTRNTRGAFTCNAGYNVVCHTGETCCARRAEPFCTTDGPEACGHQAGGSLHGADAVECDAHSDCHSDEICCVHVTGATVRDLVTCTTREECADRDTYMGFYDLVVCSPNDPCEEGECRPYLGGGAGLLDGLSVCWY